MYQNLLKNKTEYHLLLAGFCAGTRVFTEFKGQIHIKFAFDEFACSFLHVFPVSYRSRNPLQIPVIIVKLDQMYVFIKNMDIQMGQKSSTRDRNFGQALAAN